MSAKPALVSDSKMVKIFQRLGYEKVSQRGSHIKIKNYEAGSTIIIPDHKEVYCTSSLGGMLNHYYIDKKAA